MSQLTCSVKLKKIVIKKEETTIVEGAGKKAAIQERITLIKRQIEESTSDYDREKLQERLAKLAGGVGIIRVGAATEIEMKRRKTALMMQFTPQEQLSKKASCQAAVLRSSVAFPSWKNSLPLLKKARNSVLRSSSKRSLSVKTTS